MIKPFVVIGPGIITPPSSSPLTIQDDSLNGSRENGLTNGHAENGMMGRRVPQPRQFDVNPRRRAPGYVTSYDASYGGYEQFYG